MKEAGGPPTDPPKPAGGAKERPSSERTDAEVPVGVSPEGAAGQRPDPLLVGSRPRGKPHDLRDAPSRLGLSGLLSHPAWQGAGAVVAILTLLVTVGLTFYVRGLDHRRQEAAATAGLVVHTTYRRDEPGRWTMIVSIENSGPGVARSVQVRYIGVNALCVTAVTDGETFAVKRVREGRHCPSGLSLKRVVPVRQEDLPGLFLGEFERVALWRRFSVFSGTARNLHEGEQLWLEFKWDVGRVLDRRLAAAVSPSGTVPRESRVRDVFSRIEVDGENVRVVRATSRAVDRAGFSEKVRRSKD